MAFCSQCGASNWDSQGFCSSCGTTLTISRAAKSFEKTFVPPKTDYCPQCGEKNSGNTKFCSNCGIGLHASGIHAPHTGPVSPHIDNHLIKAILVTLFCCLPFGIVAIVYAAQVDGKVREGNIEGAIEASEQANKWGNWSIWFGVAVIVLNILFGIIGAIGGSSTP